MAQSTLFASSNHLLSPSDVQSNLNSLLVHPPQRPSRSFKVEFPWDCPNLTCNVGCTHFYHIPSTIRPPTLNIPVLIIGRFDPSDTPFPRRNIWKAQPETAFPLAEGCVVFLEDFGVVSLQRAHTAVMTHIIFNACDESGFTVVQIASVKVEVPPAAQKGPKRGIAFLYNLFH
ncbi:hypothetical protein FIBSPDRAFT_960418 [Athelia psychrophila]|uniref:Uncharacterized protein n=1 Tax=Athelia psychrophila TaxID=1759441 RepID=A0A166C4S7_9AGAM|nr:hypothetical protein FIBSPDRAFT_960703 [Fibularhizoctonia sp. CBS 109695]KZP13624.1 hypothetical protein FIBSPDRAFT_960418 [Fibularhizoctonia sp. CBS 109695]